jgi:hypothetical protein
VDVISLFVTTFNPAKAVSTLRNRATCCPRSDTYRRDARADRVSRSRCGPRAVAELEGVPRITDVTCGQLAG